MAKRPNFLLFITDQHRADFLGCYGHPVLRTPHIDSIAAKGTAFDKFYVASPVCMPNRSSLMTCRMPSVHGVRSNGIPLSMSSVTFVDLLREAGYRTALIGKSHLQNFTSWQPIVKRPAPREGYHEPPPELAQALRHDLAGKKYEQETPEYWNAKDARVVTPFYGFDHVTLVRAHGDEPGGDYDRWLEARDPKAKSLLGPKNSLPHGYKVPQAYRTAIPEELYATSFLGERGKRTSTMPTRMRRSFSWCRFPIHITRSTRRASTGTCTSPINSRFLKRSSATTGRHPLWCRRSSTSANPARPTSPV